MSRLTLFLLGPPRVECDGVPMKKVDTRKAIALLAYLAITHKSHRRDSIINLLWPELDESRARTALRRSLYVLNRSLPGNWLEVDRKNIGLNPDSDVWLDVDEFHRYFEECEIHVHEAGEVCPDCVKPLSGAVELYGGDFLTGFSLRDSVNFDDWQFSQAQSLKSEMMGGLERLIVCLCQEGVYEKAIGYGKRWLELDRADERPHRHLMKLYARTGERPAALRQYEECVQVLEKELGETPKEETVQLYKTIKENALSMKERIQVAEPTPISKPPYTLKHHLPRQLTSFIGRKREIEEIKGLLSTTCLLTLTGSGGCGKTRLALEVAAHLVGDYVDGVWLADLASLSNPALVAQKVASSFNLGEQPSRPFTDTLLDYLKYKQLILVLDNCEHLIESCALLADTLLSACPDLKILATSREGLGIGGELTYQVPSLSLPHPDQPLTPENIKEYEALGLFIERAAFNQPTFAVTDDDAWTLAQICHHLDGIPLAIELAASRVKALTVKQILARLDDRFRLLKGGSRTALPRQQTLRATIEWSYDLLREKERILFKRLSVFIGGWSLDAAEAICAGEGIEEYEVLDLLISLVDKSLVLTEEASSLEDASSTKKGGGEAQYRLLETVRQYGLDRLLESDEGATLRDLHLKWYLGLAERADPELHGSHQGEWLDRLEMEHDNLRAGLEWSLGNGNTERGLRLAGALCWFWFVRGYLREGRRWLEEILAESGDISVSVRARALRSEGFLTCVQGEYAQAKELLEEGLSLFREIGEVWSIAESHRLLGAIAQGEGNYKGALMLFEKSLTLFREVGDKWGIAWSLQSIGSLALIQGDYGRGKELFDEGLSLYREMGDKHGSANAFIMLGRVASRQGEYDRAETLFKESLALSWEVGIKGGIIALDLEALARVAEEQRKPERTAMLYGAAEGLRQAIGYPLSSSARADYDRSVAAARAQLGEEEFASAWAKGRAMSVEEAIEFALNQ